MTNKIAYLPRCYSLPDGVPIETDKGWEEVVKTILSVDSVVIDGGCSDPDTSLIAFLARLLDKEVYWVGQRPGGLLAKLVTGRFQ
ncbi:MAG: hypothetical protein QI197_04140 [Candidatus Korarchaeota archaeon]|nr:hypothetical protein [Candidatus Korarchaeota archaeon]